MPSEVGESGVSCRVRRLRPSRRRIWRVRGERPEYRTSRRTGSRQSCFSAGSGCGFGPSRFGAGGIASGPVSPPRSLGLYDRERHHRMAARAARTAGRCRHRRRPDGVLERSERGSRPRRASRSDDDRRGRDAKRARIFTRGRRPRCSRGGRRLAGCGAGPSSGREAAFAEGMQLLGDAVIRPRWEPAEWKRLHDLWLNDLKERASDPDAVAFVVAPVVLYGADHPYGHPTDGLVSSAPRVQLAEAKRFWAQAWRPDRATIVVVGDVTKGELDTQLEGAFGAWRAPAGPPLPIVTPPPPSRRPRELLPEPTPPVRRRPGRRTSSSSTGPTRPKPSFT